MDSLSKKVYVYNIKNDARSVTKSVTLCNSSSNESKIYLWKDIFNDK